MEFLISLAQAEVTVKETVGVLQTILSGGPLLILAVLVVVEGFVIYKLSQRLTTLEAQFRDSSVALLQDQLKQMGPLTEALTSTRDVLGRVDETMKSSVDTMTRLNAKLDAQERAGS